MDNQDPLAANAFYGFDADLANFDPNRQAFLLHSNNHQTWPLPLAMSNQMSHHQNVQQQHMQQSPQSHSPQSQQLQHPQQHFNHQQLPQRRLNTVASTTASHNVLPATTSGAIAPLQTDMSFAGSMLMNNPTMGNPSMANWMGIDGSFSQQTFAADLAASMNPADFTSYGAPLQSSPIDFACNSAQAMMAASLPMENQGAYSNMMPTSLDMAQMTALTSQPPFQMTDFSNELANFANSQPDYTASASVTTGSPTENLLDVRSLSSSDNEWEMVNVGHRNSLNFTDPPVIYNPSQTLHIRTNSNSSETSDVPRSAHSFSSWEEVNYNSMQSPQSEAENSLELVHSHHSHHSHNSMSHTHSHHHNHAYGHAHSHSQSSFTHGLPMHDQDFSTAVTISPKQSVSPPMAHAQPLQMKRSASGTASSPSSTASSPPAVRRRKSPVAVGAKPAKTIVKKTPAHSTKKDHVGEKRVGKRKGPLQPHQRQQASEIRKLRACLRCKFLKKTCDKGDPCAGCQPSHARLWQVPCTRIDIKEIAYFMKDWKADYERHVSLGFSVGNIKGFSPQERPIYITHGYGHYLPIMAREVYVRDEKCFGIDWVETLEGVQMHQFELNTARLSAGMEGISHKTLSDYLDCHVDGGFEQFVDEYFEGTFFVTEILKTAYRFYTREKLPVIRKALKLVVAYNLTLHVTMVEGLPDDESNTGKVEDDKSKFCGKTVAPVMINFQVKCALADMWRELQKDVLEELSALYSSVYSGDKLKNWPTIFMLAAIILALWELMQFDCAYRVPDQAAVNKFVSDMEGTPVGVIVGLFQAISTKLPAFTEWDTRKHHQHLGSNAAVCDAMTEVRAHVTKYETYLRSRSECKFDRNDFDCLSNKFLSKLVIRAN